MAHKSLHPSLRASVATLIKHSDSFEVSHFRSAMWDRPFSESLATRFIVTCNVCGISAFSCEFMFDIADLAYPPDIVLHNFGCSVQLQEIQPLLEWRLDDPSNVLNVLAWLRKRHQENQQRLLRSLNVEKLVFDLDCVLHHQGIEILVQNPFENDSKVLFKFQLNLNVDCNAKKPLPKIVTKIVFSLKNGSVNSVQRDAFFDSDFQPSRPLKIPDFKKDKTMIDFVMELEDNANTLLEEIVGKSKKKKLVAQALIHEFRTHCLEFDDIDFSYVSFVHEFNESITMVVNVHFSDTQPPKIFMTSTMYTKPDGYTPEIQELAVRLDTDMPPEQVVGRIRSDDCKAAEVFVLFAFRLFLHTVFG
ncbi:hypothetical protein BC829DRAFT_298269 [Chytridium lagenaria]|nr:hypothetical protein BC829DRAFT_298269 [Chytridium lagenaria]